jgi:predicted DNA-binding transcriptional regulator YafY
VSETAARLLRLLSLLQNPREWSGSELAGHLAVSPRTVRRDVDRLRELGYPVRATLGTHGGYRLAAGKAMPPLLVDDEEAVAIVIGLRTAARQPVAGIAEASLRALAKLQQVLPGRLRRRAGALGTATVSAPYEPGSMVDPEQLTLLAAAATAHERVRFDYRSDSRSDSHSDGGELRRRLVEPQSLVVVGRRWYLLAFDNDRQDWRIFRVDRIESTTSTGAKVRPRRPPTGDALQFVTERLFDKTLVFQAVVTLELPAERAAARLGDWAGELEPIDGNTCLWRSPLDTIDWLAFRLALLDGDFTVHEPPELIEHLRRLSRRIDRAVTPGRVAPSPSAGPSTTP